MGVRLTTRLREGAERWPAVAAWLRSLDAAVADAVERWGLTLGEPFEPGGSGSWVAPARTATGVDAVLKVIRPHPEARHEVDGLRLWDGRGIVRLLDAARTETADLLLLERCRPGTTLSELDGHEQDEVVASVLRQLWVEPPATPALTTLTEMCDAWAPQFDDVGPEIDPGHVALARQLWHELPRSATRSVVLCTDLHAENILRAERAPWLAIDPKPHVGDPSYDVTQHAINKAERLDVGLAHRLADLAEIDRERVRLWLFARAVMEVRVWPELADAVPRLAP